MEHALELPHDVEALRALVLVDRQTIAQLREANAQLEERNRVLAKWVFGRSSEKRVSEPADASLQGNLFLADIAAEAERLAAEHRVIATVEVPAHTRTRPKRRGEFPAHLPVVRTICELKDEDRVCACGGELKEFGEETSRELERIETTIVHETARKKYACTTCHEGVVTPGGHLKVLHLWPGQTPPPGRRRNGGKLGLGCPPRNPGGGLSHSPALALELEQVAMVHQAVE